MDKRINLPARGKTQAPHRITIGRLSVPLPGAPAARVVLGIAFCAGGLLGALPILGFWMLPVGIAILSVDIPPVRRFRRRIVSRWRRRRRKI